jgi:hypothetical protein
MGKPVLVEEFARSVAVPDFDTGFGKGEGGGGARDEPEEFGDYGAEEDAFGGEEGEDGGAVGLGEGEF